LLVGESLRKLHAIFFETIPNEQQERAAERLHQDPADSDGKEDWSISTETLLNIETAVVSISEQLRDEYRLFAASVGAQ